ncbi:hypothetical protein ACFLQ6_00190 [Thermoproteota archaeon]
MSKLSKFKNKTFRRSFIKSLLSITLLGIYLFLLAYLALSLASNVAAFYVTVIGGSFTFAVLAVIVAAHAHLFKHYMTGFIEIVDVFRRLERTLLKWKVESLINDYREQLDEEIRGILPYPLELKWVNSKEDVEEYLDPDKLIVVVRIKPYDVSEPRNLAMAALAYVSVGLVNFAKKHMRRCLRRAIDYSFTKKLLGDQGQTAARHYLMEREVEKAIASDDELRKYFLKLEDMAEEVLSRVFLREIGVLATQNVHLNRYALEQDIESFLEWTHKIATRQPQEEFSFWFTSEHLKIGCVLLGDPKKFIAVGTAPYLKRIESHFERGADGIYILARGRGVNQAKMLAKESIENNPHLIMVENSDKEYLVDRPEGIAKAISIVLRPSLMKKKR